MSRIGFVLSFYGDGLVDFTLKNKNRPGGRDTTDWRGGEASPFFGFVHKSGSGKSRILQKHII
jgi:hypothetical protein